MCELGNDNADIGRKIRILIQSPHERLLKRLPILGLTDLFHQSFLVLKGLLRVVDAQALLPWSALQ